MSVADSKRKVVMDAIVNSLAQSTGVQTSVQEYISWWDLDPGKFPVTILIDRESIVERAAYRSTADDDMKCELSFTIKGYVHDFGNSSDTLSSRRTGLIRDIEVALDQSTSLFLVPAKDFTVTGVNSDKGIMDNYSIVDVDCSILYYYNHLTP
jgi:hypothetical protein